MTSDKANTSLYEEIGDDKAFRERYGELIGSGMSAVIYARDGIVAKVYREGQPKRQVFQEAFSLAVVTELGIPAPQVYGVETFSGRTTLLMDQVSGKTVLDIMEENPEKTDECMDTIVKLQIEMHAVETTDFRPLKQVITGMILATSGLTEEEKVRLMALLKPLPEGLSICHGDFHGGNVLYDGESFRIIDWPEVTCGNPAADACRSYIDYLMCKGDYADLYLDKYCSASGKSREEILVWMPVMAGSLYGYLSAEGKKIIRKYF